MRPNGIQWARRRCREHGSNRNVTAAKLPGEQARLADTQILIHYRNSNWVKEDVPESRIHPFAPVTEHRIAVACCARMYIIRCVYSM